MSLFDDHFKEVFSDFEKTASADVQNKGPKAIIKIAAGIQGEMAARGYTEGSVKLAEITKIAKNKTALNRTGR